MCYNKTIQNDKKENNDFIHELSQSRLINEEIKPINLEIIPLF